MNADQTGEEPGNQQFGTYPIRAFGPSILALLEMGCR